MIVPFGQFAPDSTRLGTGAGGLARNVIPDDDGNYRSVNQLAPVSSELPGQPRGAIATIGPDRIAHIYAGTATGLYRLAGLGWQSHSKEGGYALAAADRWEFCQYRDKIIAVAPYQPVQVSDVSGTVFADAITSTRVPTAKHCAIVNRDWLVLGDVTDAVDGEVPSAVWTSARGDIEDFDPSTVTKCIREPLDAADGAVQRIVGGEYAVIVQERAINRMQFTGGNTVFRFDRVVRNHGTVSPGSVVDYRNVVAFLAEDGFFMFNGAEAVPISAGKVSRYVFDVLSGSARSHITASVWRKNGCFVWAIPTAPDGIAEIILLYNPKTQKWSHIDAEPVSGVYPLFTQATALDDASFDGLLTDSTPQADWMIDGDQFIGGVSAYGAFTTDYKLAFFDAPLSYPAAIETDEQQHFAGVRAVVTRVRPVVDGDAVATVQVGSRDNQGATVLWSMPSCINLAGDAPQRVQGRYLRYRVNTAGAFSHAIGVEVEPSALGWR